MVYQLPNDKNPSDAGSKVPASSGSFQKPSVPQKSTGLSEEELLKEELSRALGEKPGISGSSFSDVPPKKYVPFPPASTPLKPSFPPAPPEIKKPVEPPKSAVPEPPRPFIPSKPPEFSKSSEPLKKPPEFSQKPAEPPKELPREPFKQPEPPKTVILPLKEEKPISPPPISQKPREEFPKPKPEIPAVPERKPFVSPPPSFTPREKEPFVPSSPSPPRPSGPLPAKDTEISKEREFPREREFVPSKKEKEFISKEAETPKEIIRTFQKDLLRREGEVKRENKIPEKEIIGFTPPEPPEEAGVSKPPKFRIPQIPIPRISLKFALIIVAAILFLSGFYLVFQLKPCIPPFCKGGGGEPTPSPSLPLCDRDALKNLCQSGKDFPQCDTEKFCSEISVSPCEKTKICEKLVPVETCQPVELIAPVSLLPFISEERIIISQKSKSEIVSQLDLIDTSNYKTPYLIRILIEYNSDKCNGSWLSARELFEAFGAKAPENFFTNLKENYTLVYYLPDNEEKSACVAANNVSPFCYGPRLALTFSVNDSSLAQTIMSGWETTFFEDFKSFILGEPKEETMEFKGLTYKDKVQMRFKNVPFSTTALNYGIYKNLLIIGTSKNSLVRTIDFVLKKEEQEREILEGIKTE